MKLFLFSKSILFVFAFLLLHQVNSQNSLTDITDVNNVIFSDIIYGGKSFYDGVIHLENNETLKGKVSINQINNQKYTVVLKTETGTSHIYNENIKSVTLYSNDNSSETKFTRLKDHNKLLRELYRNEGGIIVYDAMKKPFDNKIINDVYIFEKNKLTSLYNFWSSGPKKDIINYINNRDNKEYKRRDFKSLNKLFTKI